MPDEMDNTPEGLPAEVVDALWDAAMEFMHDMCDDETPASNPSPAVPGGEPE